MIATVAEGPTIDRIEADYRTAFKRGEQGVVDALRMVKAAVKNASIAKRSALDEAEVLRVIQKELKSRRDSLAAFESGGRADLAAKERAEVTILSAYVPEALTDAQIDAALDAVFASVKPSGPADFGTVMGRVMKKVAGRADGSAVQSKVKERLASIGPLSSTPT
jgi:uncharacterized protein YqeY